MGIKFPCAHCGQRLNIKSDLAGKRGICPHCHAKIDIPAESVPRVSSPATWAKAPTHVSPGAAGKKPALEDSDESTFDPTIMRTIPSVSAAVDFDPVAAAPAPPPAAKVTAPKAKDPIAEAPTLRWYVMPEGATQQYGPAPGEVMRGWIEDGRVGIDSLVWREDWPDWLEAVKVFPQLMKSEAAPQAAASPAPVAPVPSAPATVVAAPNPQVNANAQGRPAMTAGAPTSMSAPVGGVHANPAALGKAPGAAFSPTNAGMAARIPGQPGMASMPGNPAASPVQPNAPLIKVDEPVRHLGPAHEYVPSSKRPKTGSLIVIVVLTVAMLILAPVVFWVLFHS